MGNAFKNLVPLKSLQDLSRFRVNPGKATASYLYQKIIPTSSSTIIGLRMPPLTTEQINIIANWINEGALPPQ